MSSSNLFTSDALEYRRQAREAALQAYLAKELSASTDALHRSSHNTLADAMKRSSQRDRKLDWEEEESVTSSDELSSTESASVTSSNDEKGKKKNKKSKEKATRKRVTKKSSNEPNVQQLATLLASLGGKPTATSVDNNLVLDPPPPPLVSSTIAGAAPNEEAIAQRVFQLLKEQNDQAGKKSKTTPGKIGSKVAFKRVDQVYDRKIGNYKLKETVHEDPKRSEWDQVCILSY